MNADTDIRPGRTGSRLAAVVAGRPDGPDLAPWRPPSGGARRREAALAGAGLLALAVAVYAWHVAHGGWYLDDWGLIFRMREAREDDGLLGPYLDMAGVNHRPGNALVYGLLWEVGREGQAIYNAGGILLAAASGTVLHLVLRRLGVVTWVAGFAGAAYVVLPIVDSARLWFAAYVNSASVVLALAGLLVALVAFDRSGGAARALHGASLALYAWATLTYELVAGAVVLFGVLYPVVAGRRAALRRWPLDLLVVGACVGFMAARQQRGAEATPAYMIDRIQQFPRPAYDAFASLLPVHGSVVVVLLIAGAIGVGLLVARGGRAVIELRGWAVIGAAGALFACAGWVLLLPADPYFVPRVSGLGNRVSVVAGPGMILVLGSVVAVTVYGLSALVRAPAARFAVPAALALTLAGMVSTELDNQKPYGESWSAAQRVVSSVRATVERPAAGTRFVTFHHPTMLLPADVSVFNYSWDLAQALQFTWDDPSLDAHPYIGVGRCAARGWDPQDAYRDRALAYGELYFVDSGAYRAYRIADRAACERRLVELTATG